MNAILGVSNNRQRLLLEPGQESYWCVFSSNIVHENDLLFLYYTELGIKQLYIITSICNGINEEISCEFRNMKTIKINLVCTLSEPIRISTLKAHPILKNMAAIGRNFQLTTFMVREKEKKELLILIKEKNPSLSINLV